ncbi:MAG: orotate phosphoribosyltransferase [Bdellovibrionales bacterium]|nr:orotate phosphoribosyltransferase [Bdellovibrionales bacterium]
MNKFAEQIAAAALKIGAIQLQPDEPFRWASGYYMPIYNDNRLLLSEAKHRRLVAEGMQSIIREHNLKYDVIAGTATAGIAPATSLADLEESPLIYVRPKPKDHGKQNQVEGKLTRGARALLIEDVVSTGGSSIKAALALRTEGAVVENCLCIFTYGFTASQELFEKNNCSILPLLDFPSLLEIAHKSGKISSENVEDLKHWAAAPFEWGNSRGFPAEN